MAKRTRCLDAQQEGALLDKGRIAEETLQRLQTLREAGNPHIPRSFLLSGIKERQDREKVNQALLAEDTTRMVLRHEGYAERVRDALSARKTDEEAQAPADHGPRAHAAPVFDVLAPSPGLPAHETLPESAGFGPRFWLQMRLNATATR